MALMEWNDSFSVNVAAIDQQHQKLVSMINELTDAMKQGRGNDVIGDILNGLVSYTKTHFKFEERYFAQYGYPEADLHKKEHNAFVDKVLDFKKEFDKGALGLSIEVMKFLSDWLQKHIKQSDKRYTKFFNEKGLV